MKHIFAKKKLLKAADIKNISKFFSEIYMMKRIKHIGFQLAGVENPDSVAEHSLAAAQIAFILACLEGADPYKAAAICVFHDNEEIRIGDHHKVSARYLNTKDAERKSAQSHFQNLPSESAEEIMSFLQEEKTRNTKEGVVAKDADWLEQALQAKIYSEQGFEGCNDWIVNITKALETDSAKKILAEIRKNEDFLNSWWKGLKKMTYNKLNNDKKTRGKNNKRK